MTTITGAPGLSTVDILGLQFAALTEAATNRLVVESLGRGVGGWVCPVNLDVLRQVAGDGDIFELVSSAEVVVADGMPLIWASRLQGTPLPERVAGSSMITTLSAALDEAGRSIYLLGGNEGTADAAGAKLQGDRPGLTVAGSFCPPFGFERDPNHVRNIADLLSAAAPDVVFVGLGFPKQDRLIAQLKEKMPATWFVSCGISFSFVVGEVRRAPDILQVTGLEWVHRLAQEPRRLARRYLVDGLPFAGRLLLRSLRVRVGRPVRR